MACESQEQQIFDPCRLRNASKIIPRRDVSIVHGTSSSVSPLLINTYDKQF